MKRPAFSQSYSHQIKGLRVNDEKTCHRIFFRMLSWEVKVFSLFFAIY